MKLNGTGISEYGDETSVMVKINAGNFNSSLNLNFSSVMSNLLEEEQHNSCKISTTPPERSAGTSASSSLSQSVCPEIGKDMLDSQDQELFSILEELQISDHILPLERSVNISATRIAGYFCPDTVFNLSNRVLTDLEVKVLKKGLDFALIQRKINEPELRQDFADFCRRMRTKLFFRNKPTPQFSEVPAFSPKSSWKPPRGHPNLEVFLSQLENEIFKMPFDNLKHCNTSKEEWQVIRALADDRTIASKRADKGSCVAVWDIMDYLLEAEKQLSDTNVYKSAEFKEKLLTDLVESSNNMFLNLKRRGLISQKELKYFTYDFKKSTNLGKLYLLPKIHERLSDVPGRPVISNCHTPTEKASEFVDFHLKPIMQNGWSHIRDSIEFINKIKNLKNIPSNPILVKADILGLYPNIPHESGSNAIKGALENRTRKSVPTSDILKMMEFVSKNNYSEFNESVKQQLSGTAIGAKCLPPYACIFMDKVETDFFKSQKLKPTDGLVPIY